MPPSCLPPPLSTPADTTSLRGLYHATTPETQIHKSRLAPADDEYTSSPDSDPEPEAEFDDAGNLRPSIRFRPNRKRFEARSARLAGDRGADDMPDLPDGFPASIGGERAWSGLDVKGVDEFILQLDENEIREVEAALRFFEDLPGSNGPDHMRRSLFPLPTLGPKLSKLSDSLHHSRGIVLIRGVDPDAYTPRQNVVLFAGLASYIGDRFGCQDRGGNMIVHLTDLGFRFGRASKRGPAYTTGELSFHNDVCDVLGLYALDAALEGGESTFASAAAVYDEIAATRPDVIRLLSRPIWIYDKETPPERWSTRPILFPEPRHGPFFFFSRAKLVGAPYYPLTSSIPAMSEAQAEALDLVHFVAEKHSVAVKLRRGDLVFHNNLSVFHGRKAFVNHGRRGVEGSRRRHILRLWVRREEVAWQTPDALRHDWHVVYGDSPRRGKAKWLIQPEDIGQEAIVGRKSTCS